MVMAQYKSCKLPPARPCTACGGLETSADKLERLIVGKWKRPVVVPGLDPVLNTNQDTSGLSRC
jgi:hypothetical protein